MKYKTCPECDGRGEGYVYPTREQPEEYPPCDTCSGTGQVVDVGATLEDQEQRLRVVEAFVASSQREFRRLAQPRKEGTGTTGKWELSPISLEQTNDY